VAPVVPVLPDAPVAPVDPVAPVVPVEPVAAGVSSSEPQATRKAAAAANRRCLHWMPRA